MKDRLITLMRSEGLSAAKLAEITQVQPSTISHIMAGRNNPRYDFIAAIMRHYPSLSARWLMLGEGEMYSSPTMPESAPVVADQPATIVETNSLHSQEESDKTEPPTTTVVENKLTDSCLPSKIKAMAQAEKIAIFNSDGTFSLYDNSDI
jgi:transcriptional regulator with XRE-family HTH domain